MHTATADAVIDAINEYVDAKMNTQHGHHDLIPTKQVAVEQLDRAHARLRQVLMTGIA